MDTIRILLIVALAAAPVAARAQNGPPTPCANAPERRAFDFFVGDWNVTTPTGAQAGKSSVQIVSGGCGLLENWTGLGGGVGKSLSAYNPATKQWQQFWVGQGGLVTEFRSEWRDKTLVLIFDDARRHQPSVVHTERRRPDASTASARPTAARPGRRRSISSIHI